MTHAQEPNEEAEARLAEVLAGELTISDEERSALLAELSMSPEEFEELRDVSDSLELDAVRQSMTDADTLDVDVGATLRRAAEQSRRNGGEGPTATDPTATEPLRTAPHPARVRRLGTWGPVLAAAAAVAVFFVVRGRGEEPEPPGGGGEVLNPNDQRKARLEGDRLILPSDIPTMGTLSIRLEMKSGEDWTLVWRDRIEVVSEVRVPAESMEMIPEGAPLRVQLSLRGGAEGYSETHSVLRGS